MRRLAPHRSNRPGRARSSTLLSGAGPLAQRGHGLLAVQFLKRAECSIAQDHGKHDDRSGEFVDPAGDERRADQHPDCDAGELGRERRARRAPLRFTQCVRAVACWALGGLLCGAPLGSALESRGDRAPMPGRSCALLRRAGCDRGQAGWVFYPRTVSCTAASRRCLWGLARGRRRTWQRRALERTAADTPCRPPRGNLLRGRPRGKYAVSSVPGTPTDGLRRESGARFACGSFPSIGRGAP